MPLSIQDIIQQSIARKAGKPLHKQLHKKPGNLTDDGFHYKSPTPSPYRAVAVVLPIRTLTCACGSVHSYPEGGPLVKFVHKRTSTVMYVANHPASLRPNIRHELLINKSRVDACQSCFQVTVTCTSDTLDLFPQLPEPSPPPMQEMRRYLPISPPRRHSSETAYRISPVREDIPRHRSLTVMGA